MVTVVTVVEAEKDGVLDAVKSSSIYLAQSHSHVWLSSAISVLFNQLLLGL